MCRRIKHTIFLLTVIGFLIAYSFTNISAQVNECKNSLSILGSTNLTDFSFIQSFPINNNSTHKNIWKVEETTGEFHIHIPVNSFKADNRLMYTDFMELIKSDIYPDIIISIKKKDLYEIHRNESGFNPKVLIYLAGVRKEYNIVCESFICKTSEIFITGSREIKLTDFKLTPPVKSLGLIKVKNNVFINFEFGLPLELLSINKPES